MSTAETLQELIPGPLDYVSDYTILMWIKIDDYNPKSVNNIRTAFDSGYRSTDTGVTTGHDELWRNAIFTVTYKQLDDSGSIADQRNFGLRYTGNSTTFVSKVLLPSLSSTSFSIFLSRRNSANFVS